MGSSLATTMEAMELETTFLCSLFVDFGIDLVCVEFGVVWVFGSLFIFLMSLFVS